MAHWLAYVLRGHAVRVRMTPYRAELRIEPKLRSGASWPFLFGASYDPELLHLHRYLPAGGVFVDGGANIGIYTVVGASIVGPSGRVFAFEPAAKTFESLSTNVAVNDFANVATSKAALAAEAGRHELFHVEGAANLYSLGGESAGTDSETVEVVTLADALDDGNAIHRLDLIKLDVEGAEELALQGGRTLLERFLPFVIFEIRPGMPERLGLDPVGAWEFLALLGYSFIELDLSGAERRVATPRVGNYVALPPEH